MALVAMSRVRGNLKRIRHNEDLQMRVSTVWLIRFTSFGDWDWGHWLWGRKVKAQLKPLFQFSPLSCAWFSFLSLWTVDDHSPQLLISQYTCASIRKRANTQLHTHTNTHTDTSTSVFLKIGLVTQKQTKGWRIYCSMIQPHYCRTALCRFQLNVADVHPIWKQPKGFFPPDTIIMSCGSTCESHKKRGGEEDKQEGRQEASLIFNSPMKPNLRTVLCQQGSIAATSMNMSRTISSTLLAIWRQEEPKVPQ